MIALDCRFDLIYPIFDIGQKIPPNADSRQFILTHTRHSNIGYLEVQEKFGGIKRIFWHPAIILKKILLTAKWSFDYS